MCGRANWASLQLHVTLTTAAPLFLIQPLVAGQSADSRPLKVISALLVVDGEIQFPNDDFEGSDQVPFLSANFEPGR